MTWTRTWRRVAVAGTGLLSACDGTQSILAPHGAEAAAVAALARLLFAGAAAIVVLVVALTAWAVYAPRARRRWLASPRVVIAGGIVLPVVTLSVLLWRGLVETRDVRAEDGPAALTIDVVGEQWWWRVAYPPDGATAGFATANEIWLPIGRPVELRLTTADVLHSFWVPRLAGKLDMIPGRVNRLRLRVDRAGVHRGQCAEYCGGAHALMAFHVVSVSEDEFAAWRTRQSAPAAAPGDAFAARGREQFIAAGCGACHTVRGTSAAGTLGPDLTHVGSRRFLAAGTLPAHVGTMAGWIAAAQHVKPGNRMPSFPLFAGVELRAMATWLATLE